jgi:hypothetical protein
MARTGYLGGSVIQSGGQAPTQVGSVSVAKVPRAIGLAAHVAEIKRQNIVLDAAVIVARKHNFITQGIRVELAAAKSQHFGAAGGQHAAHAVKRYTLDGKDIAEVYTQKGVDEVALIGLRTMLGLVIDVDRRANLSIDKRIETSPQRIAQLQKVVDASIGSAAEARKLARDLELDRRMSEPALLQSMQGGFAGDANYSAMLTEYMTILSAPPPRDESPELMVDTISRLIDS